MHLAAVGVVVGLLVGVLAGSLVAGVAGAVVAPALFWLLIGYWGPGSFAGGNFLGGDGGAS